MITPFYDRYPKDPAENLRWRIRCRERAQTDIHFRNTLYDACMEDILFFMAFSCVAKGTLVVTDQGLIPIERVTPAALVWDGVEWVSQEGVLPQGRRASILAYEIELTPDHKVWTNHGWKDASQRHDRAEVRLPDGYSERWNLPENETGGVAVPVPVRQTDAGMREQSSSGVESELRLSDRREGDSREGRDIVVSPMVPHATAVSESKQRDLSPLRWAWDRGVRAMAAVRELFSGYGGAAGGLNSRQNRQRRGLRTGELSLGDLVTTDEQPAQSAGAVLWDC